MVAYIPSRTRLGLGAISLADAIARQENTPSSWNNPGALTAAPSRYCQTGKINGIVQFCTSQDGWDALNNQLGIYSSEGLTLGQMLNIYAPAPGPNNTNPLLVGNNPSVYTANVSGWTGIDPNTPLNAVTDTMIYDSSQVGVGVDSIDTGGALNTTDASGMDLNTYLNLPDMFYNSDGSLNWVMIGGIGLLSIAALKMLT